MSLTKQKADLKKNNFNALEYYYVSLMKLGIVTKQNYGNVLQMLSQIDVIKLFCKNDSNFFGITRENRISINTRKIKIGNFSSKVSFQMIVSHELGHIIDNSWLDDAMAISKNLFYDMECHRELEQYCLADLNEVLGKLVKKAFRRDFVFLIWNEIQKRNVTLH